MGLFDILTKKRREYRILASQVEATGLEFKCHGPNCRPGDDGDYVLSLKQKKKERAQFQELAEVSSQQFPELPKYTFHCPRCDNLYPLTELGNFHLLTPYEISTLCKNCKAD